VKLRRTMPVPVFHDDQHGTAIISGAAPPNWSGSQTLISRSMEK